MPGPNSKMFETAESATALWRLIGYFLRLGTVGFGGPVALVGFMHRDLVEGRRWISEDTYKLSLALAQIMPGPLAAQTAIAIGYFESAAGNAEGGFASGGSVRRHFLTRYAGWRVGLVREKARARTTI